MTSLLKKYRILLLWLTLTASLAGYLYYLFYHSPDKTALLPGRTTDAHHQIEMACASCHTNEKSKNIFTSSGVTNDSCNKCHAEDLAAFSDSHPTRKFKNPENAIFIDHIDALNCITCHTEHNAKITGKMSVSLPQTTAPIATMSPCKPWTHIKTFPSTPAPLPAATTITTISRSNQVSF